MHFRAKLLNSSGLWVFTGHFTCGLGQIAEKSIVLHFFFSFQLFFRKNLNSYPLGDKKRREGGDTGKRNVYAAL